MPIAPVLLTGFEPFGGGTLNPSMRVAQALDGRTLDGARVVGAVLPCTFDGSVAALDALLRRHRPQLVLALGLAEGRAGFTPERVAINLIDARIADNAGAQPVDRPVVPHGPAAHFSTLPVKAMVHALHQAGLPAAVSYSAGTFVCNHVFYALQHALRRRRSARSGFMHLCSLPEQAAPGHPSLPLPALVEGTAIALAAALRTPHDIEQSAGRLD